MAPSACGWSISTRFGSARKLATTLLAASAAGLCSTGSSRLVTAGVAGVASTPFLGGTYSVIFSWRPVLGSRGIFTGGCWTWAARVLPRMAIETSVFMGKGVSGDCLDDPGFLSATVRGEEGRPEETRG